MQAAAQRELMAEQGERARDLEAGARALEARCDDLKQAAAGAEARAQAAAAEVLKANRIIEQLTVLGLLLRRSPGLSHIF